MKNELFFTEMLKRFSQEKYEEGGKQESLEKNRKKSRISKDIILARES